MPTITKRPPDFRLETTNSSNEISSPVNSSGKSPEIVSNPKHSDTQSQGSGPQLRPIPQSVIEVTPPSESPMPIIRPSASATPGPMNKSSGPSTSQGPQSQSIAPPFKVPNPKVPSQSIIKRGSRAVQSSQATSRQIIWLNDTPPIPTDTEVEMFDAANQQSKDQPHLWRLSPNEHAIARSSRHNMQGVYWSSRLLFDEDGTALFQGSVVERFECLLGMSPKPVQKIFTDSPILHNLFRQLAQYLDGWSDSAHRPSVSWEAYKSLGLMATLPGMVVHTNNERKQLLRASTAAVCLDRMWGALNLWSDPTNNFPSLFKQFNELTPTTSIPTSTPVYSDPIDYGKHPAARLCKDALTWRTRFEERGRSQIGSEESVGTIPDVGELASILWSSLRRVEARTSDDAAESNITRGLLACITCFGYTSVGLGIYLYSYVTHNLFTGKS